MEARTNKGIYIYLYIPLFYIAKNGTCKPFMVVLPRSKGPRHISERSIFIISKMERIFDMFLSKGRKKSGLTFQGQLVAEISGYDGALPAYRWAAIWQRQNGRCRTNQGDHLATYDEDFRIQAAGFAAAQSETGTCLWRQHACSRSQPNGIAANHAGSNLLC